VCLIAAMAHDCFWMLF